MSYTNSAIIGARKPNNQEKVADIWKASGFAVDDIERFTVMRFASMTDLTAKLVGVNAPANGMLVYIADVKQILGYVDGWHRVYPVEKQILSGTAVPASSLGATGDFYFRV